MGPGPIYSDKKEIQRKGYKKRLRLPRRCAPRNDISYEIATLRSQRYYEKCYRIIELVHLSP
jgi:hypothetical protein